MRRTGHLRRLVSGFLAGLTMLSTVLSPMTAYAAEPKAEEKPPLYEEVKDLLDEDEVVKAKDFEITVGSEFDVTCDFTGLEIKDDKKVKVTFEEAKNEEGKDFALDHADSYKAVYYVEPVNEAHPKYQISRNLIVKRRKLKCRLLQKEAAKMPVPAVQRKRQMMGRQTRRRFLQKRVKQQKRPWRRKLPQNQSQRLNQKRKQ